MIIDVSDDELVHFGVKGMRWGVRRQDRAASIHRIGEGKGTLRDHLKTGVITKSGGRRLDKRVQKFDAKVHAVGQGKGGAMDKLHLSMTLPISELIKGGGLQGGAKIHDQRMIDAQKFLNKKGDTKIGPFLRKNKKGLKLAAKETNAKTKSRKNAQKSAEKKAYKDLELSVTKRMQENRGRKKSGKPGYTRAQNRAFSDKANAKLARDLAAAKKR